MLQGYPKKPETFLVAMQGIWNVLKGHYGSVRLSFAQPFSMKVTLFYQVNFDVLMSLRIWIGLRFDYMLRDHSSTHKILLQKW